jgi:hypothetical protein
MFGDEDDVGATSTVVARSVHDDDDDEEREVAMVLGVLPATHGTTTTPVANVATDEHGGNSSTHRAKDAMDQVRKFLRKTRAAQKTKKQQRLEGQKPEVMLIPDSGSLSSSPRNRLTVNPWSAAKPSIKLISPRRKKAIRALSLSPTNMPTSPTANEPVSPTSTIATCDQEHLLAAEALALATPKTSNTTANATLPSTPSSGQAPPLTPEQARAIARKAILTNKRIQEQQRYAKFHQKPPRGNDPPGGFKHIPLRVPVDIDAGSQQSVSDLEPDNEPKHPIIEIHAHHPAMSVSTLGNSQPRNLDDDSISTKPETDDVRTSNATSLPPRLLSAQTASTVVQFDDKDKYLLEEVKPLVVTKQLPESVDDDELEKRSESLSREMAIMMQTTSSTPVSRDEADLDVTDDTEDGLPPFLLSSCSEMMPAHKTMEFLTTELQEVGELGFELALTLSTGDGNADRQSGSTTSMQLMTIVDSMYQDTCTTGTGPANLADDLTSMGGELTDTDASLQTSGRDKDTAADSTVAVFFATEKTLEGDDETDMLDSILDGEGPSHGEEAADLLNSILNSKSNPDDGPAHGIPSAPAEIPETTRADPQSLDTDPMDQVLQKVEADVSQTNASARANAMDNEAKHTDCNISVEPANTMTWSEIPQEASTTDKPSCSINESDNSIKENFDVQKDVSTALSTKLPEPDTWDVVREIAEEAIRGDSKPMSPISATTDGVSKSKLEALEDVMVLALARLAGGIVDPIPESKSQTSSLVRFPEAREVDIPPRSPPPAQLPSPVTVPQSSPRPSKPEPPRPDVGTRRTDSSPMARMRLESAVATKRVLELGSTSPNGRYDENDPSDWFPDVEAERAVSPKGRDWSNEEIESVKSKTPNADPVEGLRQSWEDSASRKGNEISKHESGTNALTRDTLEDVLALAEQRLSLGLGVALSKGGLPKPEISVKAKETGQGEIDTLEDIIAAAEQKLSRAQNDRFVFDEDSDSPTNFSTQSAIDPDRVAPSERRPDPPPSKPERRSRTEKDPDGWSEGELPASPPRKGDITILKQTTDLQLHTFHRRTAQTATTSGEAEELGDSTTTSTRTPLQIMTTSSASKSLAANEPSTSSRSDLVLQNNNLAAGSTDATTSIGLNSVSLRGSKRSSGQTGSFENASSEVEHSEMILQRGEEMKDSMAGARGDDLSSPKSSTKFNKSEVTSRLFEESRPTEGTRSPRKSTKVLDPIQTDLDSKNQASTNMVTSPKSPSSRVKGKAVVSPNGSPTKGNRRSERYALHDGVNVDSPRANNSVQDWNRESLTPKSVSHGISPRLNVSQDDALERIFTFLGLNPDSSPKNQSVSQQNKPSKSETTTITKKDAKITSFVSGTKDAAQTHDPKINGTPLENDVQATNCGDTCANLGSGVFTHHNAVSNANGTQTESSTVGKEANGKSMRSGTDGHALADDISGAFSEALFELLPDQRINTLKMGHVERARDWNSLHEGGNKGTGLPVIGETSTEHAASGISLICGLLGLVRGSDFNGSNAAMKEQEGSLQANNTLSENQPSGNSNVVTHSGSMSGNDSMKFGPGMKLLAPDDEYWDTLSTIASTRANSTTDEGPRVDGPIPQEISMPDSPPGEGRSRWFCWQPESRQGAKLEPPVVEEEETSKDSSPVPQVPLEITYTSGMSGDNQSKPDANAVTSSMGKLQTLLKDDHEDSSLSQTMALMSQSQSRSTEGDDTILEDLVNIAARIQNSDHRSKEPSSRSRAPDKSRSEPPRKKVANLIEMFKAARSDLAVGTSNDGETESLKNRPGKIVGNLIERFEGSTAEPRSGKKLGTLEEKAIDAIEKLGLATEVDEQTIKVCKDDVDDDDTIAELADSDKSIKGEKEKGTPNTSAVPQQAGEKQTQKLSLSQSISSISERPSLNDNLQWVEQPRRAIRNTSPVGSDSQDGSRESAPKLSSDTEASGLIKANSTDLLAGIGDYVSQHISDWKNKTASSDMSSPDPLLTSRTSIDVKKEKHTSENFSQIAHARSLPPKLETSEEVESFQSPDMDQEVVSPRAEWVERRQLKIEVSQPTSPPPKTPKSGSPKAQRNPVSPKLDGQSRSSRAERTANLHKISNLSVSPKVENEPRSPSSTDAHSASTRMRSPKADKTFLSRSPRTKTHSHSPRSKKFTWDDQDRKMVEKGGVENTANGRQAQSPEGMKLDPDLSEARSDESDDARALLLAVTRSGEWSLSGSELSELIEECVSNGSSVVVDDNGQLSVVDRSVPGSHSPKMLSTAVNAIISPTAISESTTATSDMMSADNEIDEGCKAASPTNSSTDQQKQISELVLLQDPSPSSPVRDQPTSPRKASSPPRKTKQISPRKAKKVSDDKIASTRAVEGSPEPETKIIHTNSGNIEIEPTTGAVAGEKVCDNQAETSDVPVMPLKAGNKKQNDVDDGGKTESETILSNLVDRMSRALTKEEFIGEMATRRALRSDTTGSSKDLDAKAASSSMAIPRSPGAMPLHMFMEQETRVVELKEKAVNPVEAQVLSPKRGLSLRERVLSLIVEKQVEQIPAPSDASGSVYIEEPSPIDVSAPLGGVPQSVTIPDAEKSPRNGPFARSPKLQIVLDRLKERRRKEIESLSKSFEESPSVASVSDISPDSDASPDVEGMLATYDNIVVRLVKQSEKPRKKEIVTGKSSKAVETPLPKTNHQVTIEEQSHVSESTEVRLQKAHELWVLGDVTPSDNTQIDVVAVDFSATNDTKHKTAPTSPTKNLRETRNPEQNFVRETILRARESVSISPKKTRVGEQHDPRTSWNSPPKRSQAKIVDQLSERMSWSSPPKYNQAISPTKGRIVKPLPESPRQGQFKDPTRERHHPWNKNDQRGRDPIRSFQNMTPPRAVVASPPASAVKSPRAYFPESPATPRRTPERRYPSPSPERPMIRLSRKGDDARREALVQPDFSQIAISKSKSSTTEENSWAGSNGAAKARALRVEIDIARKNSDVIKSSQSSLSRELETFKEKVQQTNNARGERVIAAATAAAEASRRPVPQDLTKPRIPSHARPSRSGDMHKQSRPKGEEKLIEIFDHMDARKREDVQEKLLQRIKVLRQAAEVRRKTNQRDDECDRQLMKLEQVIKQLHGKARAVHQ